MKNSIWTFAGLVLSILTLIITILFDIDIFEVIYDFSRNLELYELDEFLIPILILGIFLLIDHIKRDQERQIQKEKIEVYESMISAIHQIVNNFTNQMALFKRQAEQTPEFDRKILALYNEVIHEANQKLIELSNIKTIDKESIEKSIFSNRSNNNKK